MKDTLNNLINFLRNSLCTVSKKICHIKQINEMEETCGFQFMVEKILHQGEDSEPICLMQNNTFAVAVLMAWVELELQNVNLIMERIAQKHM